MSDYTDAVERGLKGLEAVSTGACPGCDECREAEGFRVEDTLEGFWQFGTDARYLTEASAERAAREYFEAFWSSGDCQSAVNEFSSVSCGICSSHLAGSREAWHWIDADGNIEHETDACQKCVWYLEYGEELEGWR